MLWTEGYVSGIDYTHGLYPELSPARMTLALLAKGIAGAPAGPLRYLELGFGQGLSLNVHAAANPGTFWGADFNPGQAANAQDLARASGADLTALEAAFDELARRDDLPDFDIIALHGIWSWISDANRAVIVDIARRHLKPGGLFYISYNTTPGWSPAMPLRHLMAEHAARAGQGPLPARIDAALAFSQSMVDAGAAYFRANPAVAERLKKIREQNRNYLAHEYFNRDWHPMPFSQVADRLADAKLTFGASAHLLDHVDAINLSPEAQAILADLPDPVFRETVRDYFINQQFRRDIFVKGRRALSALEQAQRIQALPVVLLIPPEDRPTKVKGALGEAELQEAIYGPVVEGLAADDFAPKSIADLRARPGCQDLTVPHLIQAMQVLCGLGSAAPAHDPATAKTVRKTSRALNTELCRRAQFSEDVQFLAAPLIGTGVAVNRFEQLFLRAAERKEADPPAFVWRLLQAQGQVLRKDGQPITDPEANVAELRARYDTFQTKRLPILRRLGIA
ncbi:methyltransferase domain-containing protein [Roseospira marina]|uniref:Methyltransferase domain-containing protein n=1 Tax=Roseospira marina TaxID=140057 RepID=A0A5M6ICS7_9PROT|nr:class I SAM-dependent methyltransferase [Roseospira marina]KAA5606080.1 methyltransferase domain-containing protein [Roseospira marina]MBB4313054.1 SAM-dependent methyltransferase [Roseospira marina]MBB5086205.1 SAM-dependent methyltransferase [Roseospira marina]